MKNDFDFQTSHTLFDGNIFVLAKQQGSIGTTVFEDGFIRV